MKSAQGKLNAIGVWLAVLSSDPQGGQVFAAENCYGIVIDNFLAAVSSNSSSLAQYVVGTSK